MKKLIRNLYNILQYIAGLTIHIVVRLLHQYSLIEILIKNDSHLVLTHKQI
nr:MAG TPA_asm: hypothetical protein [Caudoviricetes sp.]